MTTASLPEEIRREIERTQANLSQDVDALTERVTPSKIVERRVDPRAGHGDPTQGQGDGQQPKPHDLRPPQWRRRLDGRVTGGGPRERNGVVGGLDGLDGAGTQRRPPRVRSRARRRPPRTVCRTRRRRSGAKPGATPWPPG